MRTTIHLALPLAIALGLTACSGGGDTADTGGGDAPASSNEAGSGGDSATITASGVAFTQTSVQASAGEVTLTFDNQDDGTPHNLHVTGNGVDQKTEVAAGPGTQTLTLDLAAGSYDFVCDVHPTTMSGTLEVS